MSQSYEEQLTAEGFESRPYGFRKVLSATSQIIVIEPGKDTTIGASSLDEHGLRPHPDEVWERIMHLGYLDGSDGNDSLLYTVLEDGTVNHRHYRKGQAFFSVSPNGSGESKPGYWHSNKNISDRPIKLLVRVQK